MKATTPLGVLLVDDVTGEVRASKPDPMLGHLAVLCNQELDDTVGVGTAHQPTDVVRRFLERAFPGRVVFTDVPPPWPPVPDGAVA